MNKNIYLQPSISFIKLPIKGAIIGAIVVIRPSNEYAFANSLPDNRSAIAALPQTVLMLPETAWKNLKIINKNMLLDKLHKKLKRLNDNKDKKINFFRPIESDKGPKNSGPRENPSKNTAIDTWTKLSDEFSPIAISTTAGRYASIEKGAKIVIHAIVIIKYREISYP